MFAGVWCRADAAEHCEFSRGGRKHRPAHRTRRWELGSVRACTGWKFFCCLDTPLKNVKHSSPCTSDRFLFPEKNFYGTTNSQNADETLPEEIQTYMTEHKSNPISLFYEMYNKVKKEAPVFGEQWVVGEDK